MTAYVEPTKKTSYCRVRWQLYFTWASEAGKKKRGESNHYADTGVAIREHMASCPVCQRHLQFMAELARTAPEHKEDGEDAQ